MSHLPPRPETVGLPPPPRNYDFRDVRPIRPPSDHPYPPRDRDGYPRSPPPRARYPSDRDRVPDPYAAPAPYMPREPYPPPPPPRHDRREEERYRDSHYDRERRERDYPPRTFPDHRDRYEPRDGRPYNDRRRAADTRAWTRREGPDRDRDRRRDVYDHERERSFRRSASPPRPYSRRPEPSSSSVRLRSPPPPRRRSPSPRRRTPSPGRYSRSPRGSTRSISPLKSRLGPPSVHASPRPRGRDDDRYDTRRSDRFVPPRRTSRSRTRSPVRTSPARSARSPQRRAYSRSRSPVQRRNRSRSSDRRRMDGRGRSPTPFKATGEGRADPPRALEKEQKLPEKMDIKPELAVKPAATTVSIKHPVVQENRPPPIVISDKTPTVTDIEKVEAKTEEPTTPTSPQPKEEPLWKPEDTTQLDKDGIPLIEKRGILLPDSYWRYVSGKTPSNEFAQEETGREAQIQRDPIWQAMQDLTAQYAPMPTSMFLEPVLNDMSIDVGTLGEDDEDSKNFEIPAYESWYSRPSGHVDTFFKQINSKIDPLFQRRAHLEAERVKLWRESNQALLELEAAMLDVKAAERRRRIAGEQLELAMEGRLGMEYDHSKPSIADRLEEMALSAYAA